MKFNIVLNLTSFILGIYILKCILFGIGLFLLPESSLLQLIGILLCLFYVISKFLLLPLIFYFLGTVLKISIVKEFFCELISSNRKLILALCNGFLYDVILNIYDTLITSKQSIDYFFNMFTWIEIFSLGGVWGFYLIFYLIERKVKPAIKEQIEIMKWLKKHE